MPAITFPKSSGRSCEDISRFVPVSPARRHNLQVRRLPVTDCASGKDLGDVRGMGHHITVPYVYEDEGKT
jgi:hypothetical protein